MNLETNRLNTFANWPASAPVDPIRIAKAGFFYTGEGTEVQCFSCGGKISHWNYGDQVMSRHRIIEPTCAFVVNPQLSGNIPLVLGRECPVVNESIQHPSIEETSNNSTAGQDYGLTEEDEMYKSDALRLLSFINWNDLSVTRESLVNAGFYHAGEGRLRCAWCGGELAPFRDFESIGDPLDVHRMYFPRCSHAASLHAARNITTSLSSPSTPSFTPPIQSPPEAISSSQLQSSGAVHYERLLSGNSTWRALSFTPPIQSPPEAIPSSQLQSSGAVHNERLLSGNSTWRALGVVGSGARHPTHAALSARLATFERWPADRPQTPRALADAGFFYTGTDDQVRCFYCDGGLGKWEAGDAPWVEHARWFPHCGYVLLVRGQQFLDSCKANGNDDDNAPATEGRETRGASSVHTARRSNSNFNFPVNDSQIEECMESEAAMAALGAGLDAARVRRAIVRRLRVTGMAFSSSEALIDAVLDEQLNEEAWSVSPRSQRLARDILAETLRDFVPRSGLVQSAQDDSSDSRVSPYESPTRSPIRGASSTQSEPSNTNTESPNSSNCVTTVSRTESENVREVKEDSPVKKKELTLEEENRQLKEARLCKVCMDSEVSVVFLPCGHLVSCGGCGAALAACPLCRCAVRALVRAYLAWYVYCIDAARRWRRARCVGVLYVR